MEYNGKYAMVIMNGRESNLDIGTTGTNWKFPVRGNLPEGFFDLQKKIVIFLSVFKEHIGNLVGYLYSVEVSNFC
jgi:hypothetical protein